MSDTSQARDQAADAAAPVDDGLNDQERAEFAQMQEATSTPAADGEAPPANADKALAEGDEVAQRAAAEADAPGPDDEDDEADGDADAPVLGADGKPAIDAQGKPLRRLKKRVSGKKYMAEKERADVAEKKLSESALREARFDERMKIINEAIQPQQQPVKTAAEEDPEPDKEADLFAWLDWKKRDDGRRDERMTKLETERATETEERNLQTAYTDDAAAFAAEEPHFGPAYQFLMNNRVFELAEYFYGKDLSEAGAKLSPAEIKKIQATISTEERELVKQAVANDQRPAERIFRLAKARGYRPQAPAAADATATAAAAAVNGAAGKPGAGTPANGKAAAIPGSLAAEPGAAAAPGNVTEEIDRIKRGTEAGKSLSSGGGAPASPMTAQKLANMSESEFAEFMETSTPEELRAHFGN